MRKFVLGLLASLLAVSASAQSLDRPTRLSFFVSNISLAWSEGTGSAWDAGYGVALERRFSRAWSGELAVSYEQHETQPYFLNPTRFDVRTYPIDAVVRYTFPNVQSRWRPYVGAGARYVGAPEEPFNVEYEDMLAPQAAAGVEFNAAEAWSLRFDAKQLLKDDVPVYDDAFKVSVGIGWRF
jgi:opacity protein-like surface antigen